MALVTFLPGMFVPVFIQVRQTRGAGGTEIEGKGSGHPDTFDPGARVGIAFLLGPGRNKLGKKGLPVLHIPWADVERWEVFPGSTGQTGSGGSKSSPPQYHVYQHDDPRIAIDRSHFAGRENEILTRVKANIDGTIVLRDELLA